MPGNCYSAKSLLKICLSFLLLIAMQKFAHGFVKPNIKIM